MYEGDETFTVTLTDPSNATLGESASAEVTIEDDEEAPVWDVSADPESLDEEAGEAATVTVRITNAVRFADAQKLTLAFTGTATAGADFTVHSGADELADPYEVTLPAQAASATFEVRAENDLRADTGETAMVTVTRGSEAVGSVTLTITDQDAPAVSVCDRTPGVRDEIVARAPVDACAEVGRGHLAAIDLLVRGDSRIGSLKADDFDGLTGLTYLSLWSNDLTSLPVDLFDGLSALEFLNLSSNDLASLPAGIFQGLTDLAFLQLQDNQLTGLPDGIFDG